VNPNEQRYTAVAIVLHWAIAAAILSNLFVGWWMKDAIDEAATRARAIAAFQLHESIGLTVLLLTALRLLWRLTHKPPPLPAGAHCGITVPTKRGGSHEVIILPMVCLL
jgi:cytochrome b561